MDVLVVQSKLFLKAWIRYLACTEKRFNHRNELGTKSVKDLEITSFTSDELKVTNTKIWSDKNRLIVMMTLRIMAEIRI